MFLAFHSRNYDVHAAALSVVATGISAIFTLHATYSMTSKCQTESSTYGLDIPHCQMQYSVLLNIIILLVSQEILWNIENYRYVSCHQYDTDISKNDI